MKTVTASLLRKLFLLVSSILCLSILLLAYVLTSASGLRVVEHAVASLSPHQLRLNGVHKHGLSHIEIDHLTLSQQHAVWLSIDKLVLDWSPSALRHATLQINTLTAQSVVLTKLPTSENTQTVTQLALPFAIVLARLEIAQVTLAQQRTAQAFTLNVTGSGELTSAERAHVQLFFTRLHTQDSYELLASQRSQNIAIKISAHEAAHGLLASVAHLDLAQPLSFHGSLTGPLNAVDTHVTMALGPLSAELHGRINISEKHSALAFSARSTALRPWSELAWQQLDLHGAVHGKWPYLNVTSQLTMTDLALAQYPLTNLSVTAQGEQGQLQLNAQANTTTPLEHNNTNLASMPITLHAALDLTNTPSTLSAHLNHPYLKVAGTAHLTSPYLMHWDVTLPNVQRLTQQTQLPLYGSAQFTVDLSQQATLTHIALAGSTRLTRDALSTKLPPELSTVSATFKLDKQQLTEAQGVLTGKNVTAQFRHFTQAGLHHADWECSVADLSLLTPQVQGALKLRGTLLGAVEALHLTAELQGKWAPKHQSLRPITAHLAIQQLLNAPQGSVTLNSVLDNAPLALTANLHQDSQHALQLHLTHAQWKSIHAQGQGSFTAQSPLPIGNFTLTIKQLAEMNSIVPYPLTGAATLHLNTRVNGKQHLGYLDVVADQLNITDTHIAHAELHSTVTDLLTKPQLIGVINIKQLSAPQLTGSAQLDVKGAWQALILSLAADVTPNSGKQTHITSTLELNPSIQQARLTSLQARWDKQSLVLKQASTLDYAQGLTLTPLQLRAGDSSLTLAGQLSPRLNMSAQLERLPAEFLSIFNPRLTLHGLVYGDAHFNEGSLTNPQGQINLHGENLRWAAMAKHSMPAIAFSSTSRLNGRSAQLELQLNSGAKAHLSVRGQLPLTSQGDLALHAQGTIDLAFTDPYLMAEGRRLRGQVSLDNQLTGTLNTPLSNGVWSIKQAEVRDYALGSNITKINGHGLIAQNKLHIEQLEGHAGTGTINITGTLEPFTTGIPVQLDLHARKARPLANDQLTVVLDADLSINGHASTALTSTGAINLIRADIRLPEEMPYALAELNVVTDQAVLPAPTAPIMPPIKVNINVRAEQGIFVRGRGVYAELSGALHLQGSLAKLNPEGRFKLRQGQYSLAGKTLVFSDGSIDFSKGDLTNPSLYFVASTRSDTITAQLTINGSATQPSINLTSSPVLPQDEILARVLFNQSTSNLSVMEMVQMGSALASLTGVRGNLNDPLEIMRKGLRLDRLSMGGSNNTVEAGRYLMPGVYVGAKQGITGTGTQATVQIDVTKELKLEASTGTATPTGKTTSTHSNSLGILYQFDY